ncbi:sulfur oxidation c-type cytochrome SoxA [Magnetococcales bacterium HHB-1]
MRSVSYWLAAVVGGVAVLGLSSAQAQELKGYDASIDQGLHKYSTIFREMAEFPPSEGLLDDAKALFLKKRGDKSCGSCHGQNGEKLVGVGAEYPKYNPKVKKPQLLQHRINTCLTERMGQKALKWEGKEQVMLVTFVKSLSNGMPLNVRTDGPMKPFIEAGKKSYHERIGHFDVSCYHCHNLSAGTNVRAEYMSAPDNTGYKNLDKILKSLPKAPEKERRLEAAGKIGSGSVDHWPIYRTKWGKLATMQKRLRTCNKNVRGRVLPYGDDYYVNLEAYMGATSNGLPVNVPGLRP